MLHIKDLVRIDESILLLGESGVGKSTLARWIHEQSCRSNFPFIQLNISSLSEQLFESELFGHKRGSFTGAHQDKIGFCEQVGEGTLFLDEIGELPEKLQRKILTLVEEKMFYPVGGTKPKKFKGKLIFATHKNLKEQVEQGHFREDLFYRICTFPFVIKSLRDLDNKKDVILDIFKNQKDKMQKSDLKLSLDVTRWLEEYPFPGNYRELKQILKYMIFTTSLKELNISDLPPWIYEEKIKKPLSDDYYDALEVFERNFLVDKLKKYSGMINRTANKINISKVTLISKIKKYDINVLHLKMECANGF